MAIPLGARRRDVLRLRKTESDGRNHDGDI